MGNISAITLLGFELSMPMLIGLAAGALAIIFAVIMIFVAIGKSKTDKPIKPIYDKRDPKTGKLLPEPEEAEAEDEIIYEAEVIDDDEIAEGVVVAEHNDNDEFIEAEVDEEPVQEESQEEAVVEEQSAEEPVSEEVPQEETVEEDNKPQDENAPDVPPSVVGEEEEIDPSTVVFVANWDNYSGEYDGYYYDEVDGCYYEGERNEEEMQAKIKEAEDEKKREAEEIRKKNQIAREAEQKRLEEERRKAEEEAEKAEQERLAAEAAAAEAKAAEEKAKQEEAERQATEAQRLAEEAAAAAEAGKLAEQEKIAAEREAAAAQAAEEERLKAEQEAKEAAEKAEQERIEAERLAKEAEEAERAEAERLAAEAAEKERIAAEEAEKARLEAEKAEQERLEAERLAKEAEEKAEQERIAAEEAQKAAEEAQKAAEAEKAEQERIALEQARAERAQRNATIKEKNEIAIAKKQDLDNRKAAVEEKKAARLASMPLSEDPKSFRASPKPYDGDGMDESMIYGKYVTENSAGKYYFTLYDSKGNSLYESFNYSSDASAKSDINRFKKASVSGQSSIEESDEGGFFWRMKVGPRTFDGPICETKAEATNGLRKVKDFALTDISREQ